MTYNGTLSGVTFMTSDAEELYWTTLDAQSGSMVTDVLTLLEPAIEAQFASASITLSLTRDQRLVISGAHAFTLHWSANPDVWGIGLVDPIIFGFQEEDTASAYVVTSSFPVMGTWMPTRNPTSDTYDVPVPMQTTVRCMGSGEQRTFVFDDSAGQRRASRTLTFDYEPRANVVTAFSGSVQGPSGSFQEFHRNGLSPGLPIRIYSSSLAVTSSAGYGVYKWQRSNGDRDPWKPIGRGNAFYTIDLELMTTPVGED